MIQFNFDKNSIFIALCALFFSIDKGVGAPCCSGGSAAPHLLSSDDQKLFQISQSQSKVIGDTNQAGESIFRSSQENETLRTTQISYTTLVNDRTQIGASIPLVLHTVNALKNFQSGDLLLTSAYEVLPEWSYSEWKPKGLMYLNLTLPTGKSIHEVNNGDLSQTSGNGFYKLSTGLFLQKIKDTYDFSITPEVQYSFQRTFSETRSTVNAGPGASLSLSAAKSFHDVRIGISFQPTIQFKTKTRFLENQITSTSGEKTNVNTSLDLGYTLNDENALSLSYLDQTLFGPAKNTTLSRSLTLQFSKKWLR